jgi:hypothetical protein
VIVLAMAPLAALSLAWWGAAALLRAEDRPKRIKTSTQERDTDGKAAPSEGALSNPRNLARAQPKTTRDEEEEKGPDAEADEEEAFDALPPGLRNSGNLCFLNCVLQALAAAPPFVAYLVKHPATAATSAHFTTSVAAALKPLVLQLETRSGRHRRRVAAPDNAPGGQKGPSLPLPVIDGSVVARRLLRAADEAAFQGSGSGGGTLFGRAGCSTSGRKPLLLNASTKAPPTSSKALVQAVGLFPSRPYSPTTA